MVGMIVNATMQLELGTSLPTRIAALILGSVLVKVLPG